VLDHNLLNPLGNVTHRLNLVCFLKTRP
jgi:hypothetical protein